MNDFAVGAPISQRYETKRVIARGGVCIVIAAEHRFTGRHVAIKRLAEEWCEHHGARARLFREARVTEMARHPNVVEVIDAGIDENEQPYLVMDLLIGRSLAGLLISRQQLRDQDATAIGLEVCQALGASHAKGVLHRDVKPANVMLCQQPRGGHAVKLIDFGIASLRTFTGPTGQGMTQPGELIGTPAYMAPELLKMEGSVAATTDIYSLGVLLYECVTGVVPHVGNYGEIILKVFTTAITPPISRCPNMSRALSDVIMRALAHDPLRRYPTTEAFADALRESMSSPGQGPSDPSQQSQPLGIPVPPVQRRKYARQSYVTLVRIIQEDGVVLDGRSEDISEGGLLVLTQRKGANGMKATTKFALPLSGRVVTVPSVLRWLRHGAGRFAAGLQFEGLDSEAQSEIGRYVNIMAGASDSPT